MGLGTRRPETLQTPRHGGDSARYPANAGAELWATSG